MNFFFLSDVNHFVFAPYSTLIIRTRHGAPSQLAYINTDNKMLKMTTLQCFFFFSFFFISQFLLINKQQISLKESDRHLEERCHSVTYTITNEISTGCCGGNKIYTGDEGEKTLMNLKRI